MDPKGFTEWAIQITRIQHHFGLAQSFITIPLNFYVNLQDGSMVVTGGYISSSNMSNIAERYDPASDTWQSLQPLPYPIYGHSQVEVEYIQHSISLSFIDWELCSG